MVHVQSTIGNSNFDGPLPKNYVVSNEDPNKAAGPSNPSGQPTSQGRQINPSVAAGLRMKAQEHQQQAEFRAINEARHRIEIITGLGRKLKDVSVESEEGTVVFTLRSLKTDEQEGIAELIESLERVKADNGGWSFTPTGLYKLKKKTLSFSLYMIDGQYVDVILGISNLPPEEQLLYRNQLIGEMDGALIDHLFVNYDTLNKETYDGYMPKTEQEAKEVVDAIRKSGQDT